MANSDHPYTFVAYYCLYLTYGASTLIFSTLMASKGLTQSCPSPLFRRGWGGTAQKQGVLLRKGAPKREGHVSCWVFFFFSFVFFFFWCRLKVQNMLEHRKKGICLSDSDMFQRFPTGSCTSQNNCDPGSCPLAYDHICIMLQESGQPGCTHMGVVGMHGPAWSPCRLAGPGTATEQPQQ